MQKLRKIWKRLDFKETILIGLFAAVMVVSVSLLIRNFYLSRTEALPDFGGTYVEALSDSPHLLNPILATNDADRDMAKLIFSSLLKYEDKSENLVPDLAESYETSKDGKIYTVKLKENIVWHDGVPFTAEDVLFTIRAVKNPDYASPLRTSFEGVEAEASGDRTVVFTLKTPYGAFDHNLAALGILPKHIWSSVVPKNFPLADFNLKPIGTGPYRFVKLEKNQLGRIVSVTLAGNPNYFGSRPFIENVIFKSYLSEEEAIAAFNRKEVDGVLLQTAQNKNQLRGLDNAQFWTLPSLRIYAVFFNTDEKILKERAARLAINHAVNREELLKSILNGEGFLTPGPIPPGLPGSSPDLKTYEYNPEKAMEILADAGWKKGENNILEKKFGKEKEATPLKIEIITTKSIQLAATLIRDNLRDVGIDSSLKIINIGELQQNYLRTKNYQALLIGETYTPAADPYVFWHGSAAKDQGLNLSFYTNKKADKALENARQIGDASKKAAELVKFQEIVINDVPAVFLYSPNYIYVLNERVKNIALKSLAIPSNRFSEISSWYIETKRAFR